MKDLVLFGDCRETLPAFIDEARMCVTSPPYYGLRDYGGEASQIGMEQTPEEYIQQLVEVFRLVRDNLTDDGTLWVNICLLYTSPSPRDGLLSRMPSSA